CLCDVEQLFALAPQATSPIANEAWKQQEALEPYRALAAQLEVLRKSPRWHEWAHLESWKFVDGIARMLQRIAGPNAIWPTVWLRLRRELLAAAPPDFNRLRDEAKANLSRLRGEGEALPIIPPLSDHPADDPTTLPWIPIASDVPDLGKADTLPEFWEWCNR